MAETCAENAHSYSRFLAISQDRLLVKQFGIESTRVFTSELFNQTNFQKAVLVALNSAGSIVRTVSLINNVVSSHKSSGLIAKSTSVRELQVDEAQGWCEIPATLAWRPSTKLYWSEKLETFFTLDQHGNHEYCNASAILWPRAVLLGMLMLSSFASGWEWGGGSYIRVVLEVLRRLTGSEPVVFACSKWFDRDLTICDMVLKRPSWLCAFLPLCLNCDISREILFDSDIVHVK